ncbi:ATP-binding protein [Methylomarinum sp. Ch1-1]|uniref:ATP-binding protein n=1 Tax=Methylomarinum roseum TaxID=3067653 RepID=A0AAU7NRR6_9GAMM|nr:ATP-binding protein [Methylomarinum sp. Ch1-1]MDP4520362.1 ATP-binding protein [Methylomarinum sp. Ch1-1]
MHIKKVLLDYQVPSRLEEIETLADAVNNVLSDRDLAFSVNLCLEELITNTITYGLNGASDRFIHVQINSTAECLEIVLKDDAPPFDPFVQVPAPKLDQDINDRPIGGLGIHLVKKIMDDVHAYYDGTGNLIVLHKRLPHQSKV